MRWDTCRHGRTPSPRQPRRRPSTRSGFPYRIPASVNMWGQVYHGPVVLITDAFCYSACDMFAAGFQDHGIGTIIGVDPTTGAGGANVLTHAQLLDDWAGGPLESLPRQAQMRIALRRTLRVGPNAGLPVEDLGVTPDEPYNMSRRRPAVGKRRPPEPSRRALSGRNATATRRRQHHGRGPRRDVRSDHDGDHQYRRLHPRASDRYRRNARWDPIDDRAQTLHRRRPDSARGIPIRRPRRSPGLHGVSLRAHPRLSTEQSQGNPSNRP